MPRWRSPATAAAANPTTWIVTRASAIGWTSPSATVPRMLKTSPPVNRARMSKTLAKVPLSTSAPISFPNVA